MQKGVFQDYLLISPDSTNFYVHQDANNNSSTFNILSIGQNHVQKSLMNAGADTINMESVLNLQNDINVFGDIGYTGAVTQIVPPIVSTGTIQNVTNSSATVEGTIVDNGGGVIITSGVVWSTTPSPTIALPTKTVDGTASGTYASTINGLAASTTYYVRAYATNKCRYFIWNRIYNNNRCTTSGFAAINNSNCYNDHLYKGQNQVVIF